MCSLDISGAFLYLRKSDEMGNFAGNYGMVIFDIHRSHADAGGCCALYYYCRRAWAW